MPDIALPAFHITATKKYKIEADHSMIEDLERYQAFYRDAYGARVEAADLIREMARRFMERDRDFQAFKSGRRGRSRRRRSATADGPADAAPPPGQVVP